MKTQMNKVLEGIPASPGIAIGTAFLFGREDFVIYRRKISEKAIPNEIARFEEALIRTRQELKELQASLSNKGAASSKIFDAHLLLLEDRMLIEEVIKELKEKKFCVEYIFSQVIKKYIDAFSQMGDSYIRERTADVSDVGKRVLKHLLGQRRNQISLEEPSIIVAHDLSPSDTATMSRTNLLGFITDIGGKTSHTAIIAKSLEIPAVVGLQIATRVIKNGDLLIVDGNEGKVILNPDTKTLRHYQREKDISIVEARQLEDMLRDLPAETLDGRRVTVAANIEFPSEVDSVIKHGAEGIGLFRTEFLYMGREDLPSEDEQFEVYKKVAEKVAPNPLIIRTLDIGGDKFLSQIETPEEMHSFLGWRAIRFCLARPDIFKVQLRAILRASVYGNIKLMFPMISCIDELKEAKKILSDVKRELSRKKVPFDKEMQIGAMIEVPSAAITSDLLAREVDFFSIGTNDLVQYTLAVDRANEKVAYLYRPTHIGILRLIRMTVENAHKNNIWVGMCGEMASELPLVILLLGLGLDEFSAPPISVQKIKYIIRNISYEEAKKVAEEVFDKNSADKVEAFLLDKAEALLRRCHGDKVCDFMDLKKYKK